MTGSCGFLNGKIASVAVGCFFAFLPRAYTQDHLQAANERQAAFKHVDITFAIQQVYRPGYLNAMAHSMDKNKIIPAQETKDDSRNRIVFSDQKICFEANYKTWSTVTMRLEDSPEKIASLKGKSTSVYSIRDQWQGKINARPYLDDLQHLKILPMTISVRGNDSSTTRFCVSELKPQGRRAPINGRPCEEYAVILGSTVYRFWFDKENKYVLARAALYMSNKLQQRVTVTSTERFVNQIMPKSWLFEEFGDDGRLLSQADVNVLNYQPREVNDDLFKIDFPEGTIVYDDSTSEVFLAGKNGRLSPYMHGNERVSQNTPWRFLLWGALPVVILVVLVGFYKFIRNRDINRFNSTIHPL